MAWWLIGTQALVAAALIGSSRLAAAAGIETAASVEEATRAVTDRYGGVPPRVSKATGTFRVQRVGNRWMFVTPEGNPFWMLGVFNIAATTSIDNLGDSYANRIKEKYNRDGKLKPWEVTRVWGTQVTRRLQAWGFNTVAEYASIYALPISVGTSSWSNPEKLPFVGLIRPSGPYGLTNKWNYAPGPFKDLIDCTDPQVYRGYRGSGTPDVFDPNFAAYVKGWLEKSLGEKETLDEPWQIGIAMDDADNLVGFGPGPEVEAPRLHPNIAWFALTATPSKAESTKYRVRYEDPKVYSKYAIRDFLRKKYESIDALNRAWGANYTSWDSEGGYGAGTGLLDENGRNPWLGDRTGKLKGAAPGVVADLDAFLYEYAKKYFSVVAGTIRRYAPNTLVFGPATLNGWGGLTRKEVLRAAGEYVDVLQVGLSSQEVLELTARYAGDVPLVTWEGFPANADSALWRYPNPEGLGALDTQEKRGTLYAERVNFLFEATTAGGSKPVVGIKLWAWCDSWGEKTNWGLVSFRDNAYDGKEAVRAPGKDPVGYPTGGEERDYGDFLSLVRQTNIEIMKQLKEEVLAKQKEIPSKQETTAQSGRSQ